MENHFYLGHSTVSVEHDRALLHVVFNLGYKHLKRSELEQRYNLAMVAKEGSISIP